MHCRPAGTEPTYQNPTGLERAGAGLCGAERPTPPRSAPLRSAGCGVGLESAFSSRSQAFRIGVSVESAFPSGVSRSRAEPGFIDWDQVRASRFRSELGWSKPFPPRQIMLVFFFEDFFERF